MAPPLFPDSRYGCQKFPSQTQRRLFGIADKERQLLESVRASWHGDRQGVNKIRPTFSSVPGQCHGAQIFHLCVRCEHRRPAGISPARLGPCRARPHCTGLLPELGRAQMWVPAAPSWPPALGHQPAVTARHSPAARQQLRSLPGIHPEAPPSSSAPRSPAGPQHHSKTALICS